MKKATDYFRLVSAKGNKITVEFTIEQPTAENLSQSSGKSHVLGRAFGKLPVRVNGVQLKINANIMLPVESARREENIVDMTLEDTRPPVINPPATPEQPATPATQE